MKIKLIAGAMLLLLLCATSCKQKQMLTEEVAFCQSCGMPMIESETFGTEADGLPNKDYCIYCYKDGKFVSNCTMEQMIQFCAQLNDEFTDKNGRTYTREEAIEEMRKFFPTLKRWKK